MSEGSFAECEMAADFDIIEDDDSVMDCLAERVLFVDPETVGENLGECDEDLDATNDDDDCLDVVVLAVTVVVLDGFEDGVGEHETTLHVIFLTL